MGGKRNTGKRCKGPVSARLARRIDGHTYYRNYRPNDFSVSLNRSPRKVHKILRALFGSNRALFENKRQIFFTDFASNSKTCLSNASKNRCKLGDHADRAGCACARQHSTSSDEKTRWSPLGEDFMQ